MSLTPSSLALFADWPKFNGITKNVTLAIWSGHGHHQQKRGKNKKCHARHMVWLWPLLAKKSEKGKMSLMPSGLALIANGPKF